MLLGTVSFAAVKAGSSCTKLGLTSTVSGKKYTCIKSGKKLVWDKGVAVKKTESGTSDSQTVKSEDNSSSTPKPSNSSTPTTNLENTKCNTQGEQQRDSKGLVECRPTSDNQKTFIRINNNFIPINNPASPEKLNYCQLADARTSRNTPSIAYPANPGHAFRNVGVEKIVVVGVDFPDVQGKGKPSDIFSKDLATASEWISWYSNKKLRFEFVTSDQWIRAPRESKNYQVTEHGQSITGLTNEEIKTELILSIENYVDVSDATAFWVYYPSDIETITGKFAERGSLVKTKKYGDLFADMYSTGKDNYASKMPNWTYFLHETLHSQGIMGHSPRAPWVMGLMLNDSGPSHALNAWDQITLDWLNQNQIYCVDRKNLQKTSLTLVPIEREQAGITSVMIKLSETKILVVESHRLDKWSYGLGKGFYGVMVYLEDTSFDVSWEGEKANGTYLFVDGANHGRHKPQGTPLAGFENGGMGLVDGVGVAGDQSQWDLNYVMYLGESISYEGVKISLVSTGDNDTVEISRVS